MGSDFFLTQHLSVKTDREKRKFFVPQEARLFLPKRDVTATHVQPGGCERSIEKVSLDAATLNLTLQ